MELRKVKKICYALMGAAIVSAVLVPFFGVAPAIIAVVLAVAIGVFVSVNWRCPYCGRGLGRVGKFEYCPHCGEKLDI